MKKIFFNGKCISEIWGNFKGLSIHIIGVPMEEEKEECGLEKNT